MIAAMVAMMSKNLDLDNLNHELDVNSELTKSSSTAFSIDRSCIPTVPQDDQNGELYTLGIDIYEQSTLEKEILHQVDEVLEQQNQKKAVKSLVTDLKREELTTNGNENIGLKSQETHHNNQICNVNINKYGLEESEMGRKVRMGEMTPFGTCVSFNTSEINCFTKVEQYLKDQIEAGERRKEQKRKANVNSGKIEDDNLKKKNNKSVLKRKTFSYKKKRKKEILGMELSDEPRDLRKRPGKLISEKMAFEESSHSEYFPSESGGESEENKAEPVFKKRRKVLSRTKNKQEKGMEEWNTDDSDWEYSDDEKSLKIRSKSGKREQDDGNLDCFLQRLSSWEKSNNREEIEGQVKNLDGGYKVPLVVWNKLFNYQKVGVQWLWELNVQRCGGILGDEMGLGKTVQVIAFFSGLSVSQLISRHGSFRGLGPVLIICPTTVMHQWVKELHVWWPQFRVALMHESGNYSGKRSKLIQEIIRAKGILVTSFVSCVQQISNLTRYLWHYVVIDEGHKIRNPESQITNAVKQLRTPHRIILSGSPMQNNLKELWSLFDFIFPGKLGTLPVFMSEFSVPITQGGYTNASQVQVATAYKCATVLRDTISPYLLRRVKEDVKNHINLPMKNEQVLFCKLTEEQKNLYLEYLNSSEVDLILSGRYKVFVGLINLRKICNHPHLYSGGPKIFKWENVESVPEEEKFGYWKKAGKMIVVETLLKIWKRQGHRVLIFTQSKQMLRILENFVQVQGYEYLRLDGTTNIGSRQPLIRKFNEDKKYFVFLSTTHVGGLGVNLTGADRVVIYDPDWNPATDTQARERAWRIGQTNQVTIYRLITSGTIEEKIYHRQIFKQFLTNKVLKDPKQRRFFKSNDLYELFTLKDTDNGKTETSALFAGMGSEVKLQQLSHRMKSKHKLIKSINIEKSTGCSSLLSTEKVESMKKLAKILSQKISSGNFGPSKTDETGKAEISDLESSSAKDENKLACDKPSQEIVPDCIQMNKSSTKKSASHKRKKIITHFATFEGEIVPHLMNKLEFKECANLENEYQKEQDDYILRKLFSKSGIKTAMQHDRIMEEGPADYALVEGEAEKVAKEAVKALKESRRQYFENSSVVVIPRFGTKSKKGLGRNMNSRGDCGDENKAMTSSELLSLIKERNRLLSDNDNITSGDGSNEQIELLTDIRNFVSCEAKVNNVATTQEIIDRFRDRLPSGTSPLFRALLLQICEFHRDSDGQGLWSLKPDFKW